MNACLMKCMTAHESHTSVAEEVFVTNSTNYMMWRHFFSFDDSRNLDTFGWTFQVIDFGLRTCRNARVFNILLRIFDVYLMILYYFVAFREFYFRAYIANIICIWYSRVLLRSLVFTSVVFCCFRLLLKLLLFSSTYLVLFDICGRCWSCAERNETERCDVTLSINKSQ